MPPPAPRPNCKPSISGREMTPRRAQGKDEAISINHPWPAPRERPAAIQMGCQRRKNTFLLASISSSSEFTQGKARRGKAILCAFNSESNYLV